MNMCPWCIHQYVCMQRFIGSFCCFVGSAVAAAKRITLITNMHINLWEKFQMNWNEINRQFIKLEIISSQIECDIYKNVCNRKWSHCVCVRVRVNGSAVCMFANNAYSGCHTHSNRKCSYYPFPFFQLRSLFVCLMIKP